MTYQLPEPEVIGVAGWCDDGIGYTADQMQAAYQAGEDRLRALLTSQSRAYDSGYQAGRDSMKAELCAWTLDDDFDMGDTYHSSCGELWSFIDGGLKENNVRFCHGCGKAVEIKELK